MNNELKPCPFCGAMVDEDECPYPYGRENQFWKIVCVNDSCDGQVVSGSPDKAITAWNTRALERGVGAMVPEGTRVRNVGFVYAGGQHTPTVLVAFNVDDWGARDRFVAAIQNAADRVTK